MLNPPRTPALEQIEKLQQELARLRQETNGFRSRDERSMRIVMVNLEIKRLWGERRKEIIESGYELP